MLGAGCCCRGEESAMSVFSRIADIGISRALRRIYHVFGAFENTGPLIDPEPICRMRWFD